MDSPLQKTGHCDTINSQTLNYRQKPNHPAREKRVTVCWWVQGLVGILENLATSTPLSEDCYLEGMNIERKDKEKWKSNSNRIGSSK